MNLKIIPCLALVLSGGLNGCSTTARHSPVVNAEAEENLTRQISAILIDCQKIKTGMTRTELMKIFTTEGGLSTVAQQTFVYRGCPYIKVDVDFNLSSPNQNKFEGQPTDTIRQISKPYLDWRISD